MKVVYHSQYLEDYPTVSCECPERIAHILERIKDYDIVIPEKAQETDLELIHSRAHIENVKDSEAFEIALLAAGGAMRTAELSLTEPAFGLIRPPGHHASRDSAWGFCFFNNMALALMDLKKKSLIGKALVLDIDLHFGDGTVNILGREKWVSIFNTEADKSEEFLKETEKALKNREYDIVGVSAGFDTYEKDWGGILKTEDYTTIGGLVRDYSEKRFALLEGGYYIPELGLNVRAFIQGFE